MPDKVIKHFNLSKDLLEKLLKYCNDEDQYEMLQNVLKKDNKMQEFLTKNYNIIDFLNLYDSINVPFLDFYNIMPKITVRYIYINLFSLVSIQLHLLLISKRIK